ncbi:hypothetical protein [Marinospirillum alkaliphilum]|uniref:Uncharacterized protein n=1 Tax=Marinospirillum alkaliphilum DSM 21637 TaxID=1122209 RepID=A0A1K1ZAR7_9GAMM|nr:hypothetical protein [Marinospirillum alkaliphilum]SFX70621.1 hypothetical protein SAMN02745752_02602 [Marinospirillum alkaliphilum DSM 21637]
MTRTRSRKPYPLNFFILVTLLSILLVIWYVSDYLRDHQQDRVNWHLSEQCELPGPSCQVSLPHARSLRFTLHSEDPRPLELLPITVQLEGFSAAELEQLKLEVDLQGRDMYMGYNRTTMMHQGGGVFTATPLLSLCTDSVMVWRASILVNQQGINLQPTWGSYFDFTVIQ